MVWDKLNRSNGRVTIDFYPNTLDNTFWSKEGIVAVGGNDHVSLFVPRFKANATDERRWDKINLKTSLFTLDDIQLQLPLSWKNFSIGEEMSESHVISLDWSPPGLGKHRRSVLAVLTSNHVLSIWECVGKFEIATDWVRVCVVNHVLQAHYKTKHVQAPDENEHEHFERLRAKQRIRAFAWSQAPSNPSLSGATGDCTTSNPFLVVSTDRGDVFIVKPQSPYDLLKPGSAEWSLSVAASFSIHVPETKQSPLAACMPVTFKWRVPFVDQLAWSPWVMDENDSPTSILAFTSQSSLQCMSVKLSNLDNQAHVTTGPITQLLEHVSDSQAAGCMKWAPKLKNSKDAFLVFPTRNLLYCLQVQPVGLEFLTSAQEINTPWDEISGLCFVHDDNENLSLHLSYHLASGSDRITCLALPFTSSSAVGSTAWQHDLLRGQRRFSEEYSLAGNVMAKTYGLCTSPLGDLVAVNVSFHPSDGVEYTTNSDEISYLITSPCNDDLSFALAGSLSHPYELSAEAFLFSLQNLATRDSEAVVDDDFVAEQIMQVLDLAEVPLVNSNQTQITEDTSAELIVRQVRQNILFNRESVKSRLAQLLKYVKGDTVKTPPLDSTVVLKIVTEVARLPHFVADASPLSHSIMQIHCLILAKLQARAGNADADTSGLEEEEIEKCGICDGNIPFESLRWAKCDNNHQYPRCTLSFLAIQTPGTAKACNICSAQYINEFMMPCFKAKTSSENGVELMQGALDQEPLISLARILFAACDRCVCCGGQFTG